MPLVASYIPDRFGSAVSFYVAHRLRYPETLVHEVAARLGLTRQDRVLDLGCGPGYLAIALASRAGEVVGMDPDPAMLAAARDEAARAGVAVRFVEGSSYDLTPALGSFKLVVMGRSFHWMDRPATLTALATMVTHDGAVALFADSHERTRENRWREIVRALQREAAPASESERLRADPDWDSHAAVLLDSAFSHVERHGLVERRRLSAEDIVGRALSMSATSPEALGAGLAAFQDKLRRTLHDLEPSGAFAEVVEFSALVGRRPAVA